VKNTEFVCEHAEGFIPKMVSQGDLSDVGDIVAVLNPGRGGLSKYQSHIYKHTCLLGTAT
jgi:hypothetical protein